MEEAHQSKAVLGCDDNKNGRSHPRTKFKCQLCDTPVAFTKAVEETSGGEDEFTASLEWLHSFLVTVKCLEEGDKQLLNCSALETCESCKSNLKFVKKHGEKAVRQHAKVKRAYEKLTNDLETLQRLIGPLTLRLHEVLAGPGNFQGELPRAIGKAFGSFRGLQDTNMEVLSFLSLKFNKNSGLFPFLFINTENCGSQVLSNPQDPQDTDQFVKVEVEDNRGTGTSGEESDRDENEQNLVVMSSSIAGCLGAEDNSGSVNVQIEMNEFSGRSNTADNQLEVHFLESSDENVTAAVDDDQNVSLGMDKTKKSALQKKGKASKKTALRSSSRISGSKINDDGNSAGEENSRNPGGRRPGKKRQITDDESATTKFSRKRNASSISSAFSENKKSFNPASGDATPAEIASSASEAVPSLSLPFHSEAVPPIKSCRDQTPKRLRMPSAKIRSSVELGSGNYLNIDSSENWAKKLKELESSNQADAITLLNCMAYLKPDEIRRDLLSNLPQRAFKGNNVKQKVDSARKYLLKHSFIKKRNQDGKMVLSISVTLQEQVRVKLENEGLEEEVLELLVELFSKLNERKNEEGEQCGVNLEESVEHALNVWKCAVYYPNIVKRYSGQLCEVLDVMNDQIKTLNEEGINLGEVALDQFKKALGSGHRNCVKLEKSISVLLRKVGKYAKSAEKLEELTKKYVLKGSDDDDLLLEIRAELGEALFLLGRFQKALTIQRQVLEKTKAKEGDEAYNTLVQEWRYGRFLSKTGKLPEALEVFKCVEKKERKLQRQASNTVFLALANVAFTYSEMEEYENALKNFKEAHKMISSRWEENVELFAEVSTNLGDVLLDMNNFPEALEHISRDYEKVKGKLGGKDYWTLQLLQSLGSAHRGNGRDRKGLQRGLKMHKEAYLGLLEIDGEEDANAISAKNEIALDLSMLGRHEEALKMFKENISEMENMQRFPERLMEFELNYVEALQRSGETGKEVLRRLEAIKEEFDKVEGKVPRQINRARDLINCLKEKIQSTK